MPHPLDWLDDALADLDRRGLRRKLSENARQERTATIEVAGQSLINFGSNDYLGLASDPRVAAAAKTAIDQFGWGSAASPLVTGRSRLHAQLERELAEFQRTAAALLFPTGYAANVGTITALVGKGDVIYSDELNHASIIDGCRLSGATTRIYPNSSAYRQDSAYEPIDKATRSMPGIQNKHYSLLPGTLGTPSRVAGRRVGDEGHTGDVKTSRDDDLSQLRAMLSQDRGPGRKLIISDAIFSMHGTVAPVAALAELSGEFNAMLMIDEAHAIGVLGDHGAGLSETAGGERVDIRVGTLSKALGGHGGFAAGSQLLIDWLRNRARPYIFSTAAPAAVAAAGLAALEILRNEPQRRESLARKSAEFRRQLIDRNLIKPTSRTHIIPIFLGQPDQAVAAATELRRRGFYVPAIRPPSVPAGQSLLRISLTCSQTDDQIRSLIAALIDVIK